MHGTCIKIKKYSLNSLSNRIGHRISLKIKNYMLNITAGSYVIFLLIKVSITSSSNKIIVYHILHNVIIQTLPSFSQDLLLTWLLSSCSVCVKVARRERHHSCHNAISPLPARYNGYVGDAITTCYRPHGTIPNKNIVLSLLMNIFKT